MKPLNTTKNGLTIWVCALCLVFSVTTLLTAEIGIWTSASELSGLPTSGCIWNAVKNEADAVDGADADVSDINCNNNVGILAAGIVYARTGTQSYKDEIIEACSTLEAGGTPGGNTLAWARETGAYVIAADLVGYYDNDFKTWCRNMAQNWDASDGRTMYEMFRKRGNNFAGHGLGSLCAIYAFLEDSDSLEAVRDYWIQTVNGPKPSGLSYGSDMSWHADEEDPRLINPKGSTKQGMNIDGVIPDDMRRGGSFKEPPGHTDYCWGHLQGTVMGARILDRAGLSIYASADSALYRAVYCLQVRYENDYGSWAASGDDEWQLPFWDEAYGTNWSDSYDSCTSRIYDHGKNAGWGYVTLDGGPLPDPPAAPSSLSATAVSSSQIDLSWTDNADNESGFKIERSEDNENFSQVGITGANDTDHSDTGLSASTKYYYKVRAYNAGGNSSYSNVDSATTQEAGPVDDVADSDIAVKGTVSGSYTDTQTSNDVYESIEERESGGKPSNRYTYLEHKWTIDVTGGSSVAFYIEAFHTSNTENDDFVFAYSTDDENYTNMVTVTKTSDDDTYQSYGLPGTLSGTVYIRVKDTDQTPGNRNKDIIYIDHMYIRSSPSKRSIPFEITETALPNEMRLYRNYPNPFNPSTIIRYSLSKAGHVKLNVYDMMGRTVAALVNGIQNAGEYTHVWEAVDSNNHQLPSGVYLCRLQTGSNVKTMKMMFMR